MQHPISRLFLGGLTASALSVAGLAVPAYAADGPTLTAGVVANVAAAPGGRFDATLSVTNTGAEPVDGLTVTIDTDWGFENLEQYANCDYTGGQAQACTFDQTIAPGASYRVVLPYRARADTYAPSTLYGVYHWLPAAGHQASGTPGTGSTLRLAAGDRLGTSEDGDWQHIGVAVTGEQGSDLVAIGGTVTGTLGTVVEAEVGVRNDGPATLNMTRSGTSPGFVDVTIPAGTSVVSAPGCYQVLSAPTHYGCQSPDLFKVGETATFKITLRLDQLGDVTVPIEVNPTCQCDRWTKDRDKSNDKASLVVTTTAAVPDVTAPVIRDSGLVANQPVRAVHPFYATVTDNVAVTRLEVTSTSLVGPYGNCGKSTAQPDKWVCKIVLTQGFDNELDSTITVKAYDAAGNVSDPVVVPVHVDNKRPSYSLSPAAKSSLRSGPVTITLPDMSADVTSVKVTDGLGGPLLTTLTAAPWSYAWNATDSATPPCFQAADPAGNLMTHCTDYIVDDENPVIDQVLFDGSYSSNRLDEGTGWVGARSYVRAEVTDESPITRTEWWVNGSLVSTSFPTFEWDAQAITAPTATVELRIWDAAGNPSSKSFPVNIDKAAPAATVTPAQNTLVRGTTFVTTIKATDRNGIAYTALEAPDNVGPLTSARVRTGRDGARTVTWVMIDKLGNYAYLKRTVIVDNTAPAVAFKSAPANKAKLRKTVTVKATATDRNGIAKVQLLVNGKVVATDTRSAYTFTLNPKKYGKTFTVQLRAYDRAGNLKVTTKRTYRR
ncbi:Ig-like domain-containing protein [Actinoplanes sp. L3-i22]|uniref:Ig-like domain-containing protein n=1 Tax=Actinoplanes sp. L3-i22 TaxID=2836373 RepID=UPI001C76F2A3|nr:Ig-like domain-containing protein [Actinoplanes sp. L3-i22]BCY15494.1 hypothetical protein L3i22_105820 [Actinoplanes sp. L3-i22]